jgi:formylglycine-generating enzyme required for sulfatase activity
MKTNNFKKLTMAVFLAVSVASCTGNYTNIPVNNNTKQAVNEASPENKATITLNLSALKKPVNNSFSAKRISFTDSKIDTVLVTVYGVAPDGTTFIDSQKEVEDKDNLDEVNLTVSANYDINNKVISVETFNKQIDDRPITEDDKKYPMTVLMASTSVKKGLHTTLMINYGTYPAAKVLKTLMDTSGLIAYNLVLDDLNQLIDAITGYDANTNTYGGINPAYVDIDGIVAAIIGNAGVVPLPYTRGNLDKEIKGKLKVKVTNSDGDTINNPEMTLNDLTATKSFDSNLDLTTFEDISSGTWVLRVYSTDSGDKTYSERKVVNTTEGGVHVFRILNGLTTVLECVNDENCIKNASIEITPDVIAVKKLILEPINDNDYLAVDDDDNPKGISPLVGSAANPIVLEKNKSMTVKAKILMSDNTTTSNIDWTATPTGIGATVTVSGSSQANITGKLEGSAVVTATSRDDDINGNPVTKNIYITVTDPGSTSDRPTITSFAPTSSTAGTVVTIKGTNFDDADVTVREVTFNGVAATITDFKDTEMKVVVPAGATTGKIKVTITRDKDGVITVSSVISTTFFIVNGTPSGGGTPTDMIFIQGDEFDMGRNANDADDFDPQHKVNLKSFFIDRTEVTNEKYLSFGGLSDPGFINDSRFNRDDRPVVGVSWFDAIKYCNARSLSEGLAVAYDETTGELLDGSGNKTTDVSQVKGYRLPTEAEWEFAARGTDKREYPWGGDAPGESNKKANGYFGSLGSGDGYQYTSPVGDYTKGDSPFGVKDMAGNAYEWVNDWYSKKFYLNSPLDNPVGPSVGGSKVIRGGSWYNHTIFENDTAKLANSLKTYSRLYSTPENKSNYIGFRTVISR